MDINQAILKRRSVRTFTDKEVNDEIINQLLVGAMAAPSACNKKPWEFYIIKNEEVRNKLKTVSRYSNYNSPLMIVVCADDNRSLGHRINDFWIQDCSAAIENILLSAVSFGLGTCWCGLFPMALPVKKTKEILSLKDNIIPLGLIHVGYPLEETESRSQFDAKRVHIIE